MIQQCGVVGENLSIRGARLHQDGNNGHTAPTSILLTNKAGLACCSNGVKFCEPKHWNEIKCLKTKLKTKGEIILPQCGM